ncbi:MAG: hypothetical protein KGI06_03085 [Candidatus Micrarchaeota archaeon]|nr:hypothetical protein [Candidatus Micrarchaeota archaeon]
MGWHCHNCNYWNVDSRGKCANCGAPQYTYAAPTRGTYKHRSSSAGKIALVVVAIIILAVIVVIAYTNNHNNFSGLFGNSTINQLNNGPSASSPEYVSIQRLIENSSSYLNKLITTNGLLVQMNLGDQVPGSYSLFDSQSQAIRVILPQGVVFQNRTNYTITGVVSIYHFPPAQWNGYTNNQYTYYINGSANVNSSQSTISGSASGDLVFCINRLVFRTSNSRGLNESQIQELVNYCEYYGYAPGVVNGTNYTYICQGVKACQQ